MERRRLGRSDIEVSVICLGSMNWGDQNTEKEGHAQLDVAFEHGVNAIDTAELYTIPPIPETHGRSEEIIGSWLQTGKRRDDIILASKVIGRTERTWFRKGDRPALLTRDQINEAIDGSLSRLKTDYIDLYQVHWPDRDFSSFGGNPTVWKPAPRNADETPIEETLEALTDLVKVGKVRALGLSNENPWGTMQYLKYSETRDLSRMHSIQNAYSLANRTFETGLAEIAEREDVGLLAYSPLAQGFLSGKYLDGQLPHGARRTLFNRHKRYEKPGSSEAYRAYGELARSAGMTPAQLAHAFVTSRPFVTANIIGATSLEQLRENLESTRFTITEELENSINEIHQIHCNPAP